MEYEARKRDAEALNQDFTAERLVGLPPNISVNRDLMFKQIEDARRAKNSEEQTTPAPGKEVSKTEDTKDGEERKGAQPGDLIDRVFGERPKQGEKNRAQKVLDFLTGEDTKVGEKQSTSSNPTGTGTENKI